MLAQRAASRVGAGVGRSYSAGAHGLRVCPEVLLIAVICTLDMLTTAYWLQHHMATEANPLLRLQAEHGLFTFCAAKLLSFVPALAAAEWYSRRRPDFIRPLLRLTASLYLTIYVALVGRQFWG